MTTTQGRETDETRCQDYELVSEECPVMETVEAIQCHLGGSFYILWPGTPEQPPPFINDEDIYYENPRRFDSANEAGPVFEYRYSPSHKRWYLQREIKTDE